MAKRSNPAAAVLDQPAKTTTPTQPQPIKKISFGKIAKKEDTRSDYPILPDPKGQFAIIAARILERVDQLAGIESALETDKAELKQGATPYYFHNSSGKVEIPSSISVHSNKGEVLVTFTRSYKGMPDESAILPILEARTSEFFKQSFTVKIDGDKIPVQAAEELMGELSILFAKHGALEALQVKDCIKPVPEFHTKRHLLFTPEQNLALDAVCPMTAMVKTKGRR